MALLASTSAVVNDRPILSSERILHKDNDCKGSGAIESLVMILKGLGTMTK
jgi:hypothetical protein